MLRSLLPIAIALFANQSSHNLVHQAPSRWPEAMKQDVRAREGAKRAVLKSGSGTPHKAAKKASKPLKAHRGQAVAGQPGSARRLTANPYEPTPEELAASGAYWRPYFEALEGARTELHLGHLTEARSMLEGGMAQYPSDPMMAQALADVCFRQNQPGQAFAVLAPLCTSNAEPRVLVLASLAAARRGIVYDGQRDYVAGYALRMGYGSGAADNARSLPQGNTARAVEALSCIAIASTAFYYEDDRRYYLSEALRLDPGNPLACFQLGSIELAQRHYGAAAQLFSRGTARADGDLLDTLRQRRGDAQYWHDTIGG